MTDKVLFSFLRNEGSAVGGGRFWQKVCDEWENDPRFDAHNYSVKFFNISGPLRSFLMERLRGKKIIVRVDGVYHEKISRGAVQHIPNPMLRVLIGLLYATFGERDWISEVFNFFPRNFGILLKIKMSSVVIYQSHFSQKMYARYFPHKKSQIVTNAYNWSLTKNLNQSPASSPIRLITTYDFWRPSKRLHDLVEFVLWCNEKQKTPVHLTILGYRTDRAPKTLTKEDKTAIESTEYFSTVPFFKEIDENIRAQFMSHHMYATFTYRDNCPNAVIEAMSFGLPVLAMNSGGLPDIVKDAGKLVYQERADDAHFTSFDRSYDYPPIDFQKVFLAMKEIMGNYARFQENVKRRFENDLDLKNAAKKYLDAIKACE